MSEWLNEWLYPLSLSLTHTHTHTRARARAHVLLLLFLFFFLYIHLSGVLAALFGCCMAVITWNCCYLGGSSVYSYNHAPVLQCHFIQSHISRMHVCLAATCHLHFWQNHRDLLRATAITQGWNGHRAKSQHRVLETKIFLPSCGDSNPGPFLAIPYDHSVWPFLPSCRTSDWMSDCISPPPPPPLNPLSLSLIYTTFLNHPG